jgi:hypothetical protein
VLLHPFQITYTDKVESSNLGQREYYTQKELLKQHDRVFIDSCDGCMIFPETVTIELFIKKKK